MVTFLSPPDQLHPNCALSCVTGCPGAPASGCVWEVGVFPTEGEGHTEKVMGKDNTGSAGWAPKRSDENKAFSAMNIFQYI